MLIQYDPADLAEIHVFYQNRFVCRAICQELTRQGSALCFRLTRDTARGDTAPFARILYTPANRSREASPRRGFSLSTQVW